MAGMLTVLVGRQGSGKSTEFARLAEQLRHTSLILDPGGAQAYRDYQQVGHDYVYRVPRGATGRIYRLVDTGDRLAEIGAVFGYHQEERRIIKPRAFLNGNLFLEDAGAYLDSNLKRQVRAAIKSFKQYGLNLYLSYHSIEEISTEILRLQPHVMILKKTGDSHVFGGIAKARKFDNYNQVMEAFYRAKFMGLTASDIFDQLPPGDAWDITKELRLSTKTSNGNISEGKELCAQLSKWANGKTTLTQEEKTAGKYHAEYVRLR